MRPSSDTLLRAGFEPRAESAPQLAAAAQRLVAHVPMRARVLEIGCGTGLLARELAAKRGAKVTAIDITPRMIDMARVRTDASLGIELKVADFLALSPRGFDVVISVDTLHELALADAAARMAAAVVPGGRVLIADECTSWFVGGLRRELRSVMPGIAVRRHLGGRYTAIWQRR